MKILVIDDDSGMLTTLSYILKDMGYDVVPCSLAVEALEIIKRE